MPTRTACGAQYPVYELVNVTVAEVAQSGHAGSVVLVAVESEVVVLFDEREDGISGHRREGGAEAQKGQ